MIQRLQTLYLAIAVVLLGAFFFVEAGLGSEAAQAYAWFAPALWGVVGLALILGAAAIFLYGNRPLQRRVVVGAQVVTVVAILVLYGGLYLAGALDVTGDGGSLLAEKLVGLLLPVLAYVFFLLARRRIDQDIALVRSMDRLR